MIWQIFQVANGWVVMPLNDGMTQMSMTDIHTNTHVFVDLNEALSCLKFKLKEK